MRCVFAVAGVIIKLFTNFLKCKLGWVKVWQISFNSPKFFHTNVLRYTVLTWDCLVQNALFLLAIAQVVVTRLSPCCSELWRHCVYIWVWFWSWCQDAGGYLHWGWWSLLLHWFPWQGKVLVDFFEYRSCIVGVGVHILAFFLVQHCIPIQ